MKTPTLAALVVAFMSGGVAGYSQQVPGGGAGQLNSIQSMALGQMEIPAELTEAVTAATSGLQAASFQLPLNASSLEARANALANAELALALTRAAEFERIQGLLQKISPAQAAANAPGNGRGGNGRGGGGFGAAGSVPDNNDGFVSLFDGRTLNGWEGDSRFWSVQDGVIVGESTADNPVPSNTFLIWRGGILRDFELKVEGRFLTSDGNSGIQVRSRMSGAGRGGDERPYGMSGYQMDMLPRPGLQHMSWHGEGGGNGMNGHALQRREPTETKVLGLLGGDDIDAAINSAPEWNSYHIIAKGNILIGIVNGRVANVLIDENGDNSQAYALEGLLGLQMHTGNPFRIEFRNIWYKDTTE